MITLGWYLLKVIICSGILCGYYFLALRNKAFHRWNRFYLLASIVISLLVPIMKIDFFQPESNDGAVVHMLQTISYGDEAVIEYSRNNSFQLTTQNITEAVYLLVSIIFLSLFFLSLYKIIRLKKSNPETRIKGISFINTNAKGTPFSFFQSIFWNKAIDLHSAPGQQIFNHEIAHIKEKHSYDKIFMNVVLIFFWINPFFWLMKKELNMIHEFIADKEALEDSDVNAFAAMILKTVFPTQNFSLTNNFFYSPIKRRLLMLTKNKNPRVNYISRLLVLPLAAIVFFAFTLKVKNRNTNLYDGKTITVIIDAGHGGEDNGAVFNNEKEKDINLAIAKKIAGLNSNSHLKIILSRDNDQRISVKDRVVFTKNNKADLFISIHVGAAVNEQLNGFSVLVAKNYNEQDQLLGSALVNELKKSYKTEDKIGERDRGVWVLDHNVCPAALIQCGYLSNSEDAAFISNSANQEKIAKNILDAIEVYASSINTTKEGSTIAPNTIQKDKKDSVPYATYYKNKKIDSINGMSDTSKIRLTFTDGSHLIITNQEALKNGLRLPPPPPPSIPRNALYIINGKISTNQQFKELESKNIESVNVLKGDRAIKKYGEKGKNGVIEVTTKYKAGSVSFAETNTKAINVIPKDALVIIDGENSTPEAFKQINPNEIESITILKNGAEKVYGRRAKNGVIEITTKKTVLLHLIKDSVPDKVFTKVETEAAFPGGQQAWIKYISRAIQDSIDKFTQADYGTCVLRFIVNTDGRVSDVVATTMQGTNLAEVAINAIRKGPKWIAASQNGHTVAAYRLQPVTLRNPDQKVPSTNANENKQTGQVTTGNDNKKIFVNLEESASFPGGNAAWLRYISRVIQKNGNELISDKNNEGTCKVLFIVDKDGTISDVRATTMQGTKLAEVAVNAIKYGPNWIPGKQNGHLVNSYRIQPVSFKLKDNIGMKNEPE